MNNDEKIAAYKKLMKLQKIYLYSILLIPLFMFISILLSFVIKVTNEDTFMAITFLLVVPIIFINGMRLLAHDYCPWCKSSFFVIDTVGYSGANLLFRKNCRSCGEPKHLDCSK